MPRLAGHRAGTENLRRVIEACVEFDVKYLTLYAFSTENWGRPLEEVRGLMRILEDVIDRELQELNKQGVQLRHIGRLDRLKPSLHQKVLEAIEYTKDNDRLILCVAFNYGGRDEIVCAAAKRRCDHQQSRKGGFTGRRIADFPVLVNDKLRSRTAGS